MNLLTFFSPLFPNWVSTRLCSDRHQIDVSKGKYTLPCLKLARHGSLCLVIGLVVLGSAESALALQRGARGTRVVALQSQLKSAGYYVGPGNGYYDLRTQRAVMAFQRDRGLRVTGVADADALTLLGIPPTPKREPVGSIVRDKLAMGSRGPEVAVVQTQLEAACYSDSPSTGQYDFLTEVAVRRVQNARGVFRNGVLGAKTRTALKQQLHEIQLQEGQSLVDDAVNRDRGFSTLRQGNRGAEATILQQQLKILGYYRGEVTHCYDSATRSAVRRFQLDRDLPASGILGPATRTALKRQLHQQQVLSGTAIVPAYTPPSSPPPDYAVPTYPTGAPAIPSYQVPTYPAPNQAAPSNTVPAIPGQTPRNYTVPTIEFVAPTN